jgi:hypothetical protein
MISLGIFMALSGLIISFLIGRRHRPKPLVMPPEGWICMCGDQFNEHEQHGDFACGVFREGKRCTCNAFTLRPPQRRIQ